MQNDPKNIAPPAWPLKVLRFFVKGEYVEEIEGDMEEIFADNLEHYSAKKAKRLYTWEVLKLIRPTLIKNMDGGPQLNQYGMFKSYMKISWRSLLRQKMYSFINISGLAIGITAFLMVFLYVQHELSYDRFYDNSENIYRVYQKNIDNFYLGTDDYAYTPVALAPTMTEEFPEVAHATRITEQEVLLSVEDDHYYEKGIRGDENFFDVFQYELLQGNPETALSEKYSIILSESLARKIFKNQNPIGQAITYSNRRDYTVTGIIKDLPENSSIEVSFISSLVSSGQYEADIERDQWGNNDYYTFFTFGEGGSPEVLESKFPALLDKNPETRRHPKIRRVYLIQSLSELHLEDAINFDIGIKGNPQYLYLFSLIAIIVLLLACINYMNLAIARSMKRAQEVGLRKVMGAFRSQLIIQFLGESILVASLALILSLGVAYMLTPIFGEWLERSLELDLFENMYLLPGLLILVTIIGIFSGSYPAFFMSHLRPSEVLKGKLQGKMAGMNIQKWLIGAQYSVSIVLIIGSMVIYSQFSFIQNKELGYDKGHVLTVSVFDRGLMNQLGELRAKWASNPNIISVTATAELPTNVTSGTLIHHLHETKEDAIPFYRSRMNYGYLDVFGIELIAGRDFSRDVQADLRDNYIINESAAKAMGWTAEEAVGKQFTAFNTKTVIGVIEDFHMHSMHLEIKPLLLMMEPDYFTYIALKVSPNNLPETISAIEATIKEYSPYPFEYAFLDEKFDQIYKSDSRFGEMIGVFTLFAILIASLGLFGQAAYTTSQRTKEIGIRKVLGASIGRIVAMLGLDFLKLIVVGFLISIPIAWYVMNIWLADFAYRIDIEWWIFVVAGLLAVFIAAVTISSQSIKAALSNPVDCLRSE